jgi:hypothetical protein
LLSAICAALDVPLSRVLCDAGTEMACQEAVERRPTVAISVPTTVVIPHPAAMAVA